MSLFDRFPFTNMHRMNLDWIIKRVGEAADEARACKDIISGYDSRLADLESDIGDLEATVDDYGPARLEIPADMLSNSALAASNNIVQMPGNHAGLLVKIWRGQPHIIYSRTGTQTLLLKVVGAMDSRGALVTPSLTVAVGVGPTVTYACIVFPDMTGWAFTEV